MPDCFSSVDSELEIQNLVSDSRKAVPNSLYFAVKSQASHSEDYVAKAIEGGAVAVVTDDESLCGKEIAAPLYFDRSMSKKVSAVASTFYENPSRDLSVVGITGTNGKTSCCFWLSWLLNQSGIACGQIGTLGFLNGGLSKGSSDKSGVEDKLLKTGFTTPDPIQTQRLIAECRDADAKAVVMEVSSHGLDQGRVEAVQFKSAIFTNLSQDHLDYHQTMSNYFEAKLSLFKRKELHCAVVNLDDEYSEKVIASISKQVQVYRYSLNNPEAELYFSDIQSISNGYRLCLHSSIDSEYRHEYLSIPVYGEYNLSNLLAVSAVALAHSVDFDELVRLLSIVPGVPGRLERAKIDKNSIEQPNVLVDFAHTPDAVSAVLSAVRSQVVGKLITVVGCGGNRDRSKRPLMAQAAAQCSDVQFFTSDNPRNEDPTDILGQMAEGLSEEEQSFSIIADRKQAISAAIECAGKDDVVLVLGRGHETHQEIMGEKLPFHDLTVCTELLQKFVSKHKPSEYGGHCD